MAHLPALATVKTFNLSDIGEGLFEVEILRWAVEEGDTIDQFDTLCQVESDKATADIPSGYTGRIAKLYHRVGDLARIGQPLVDIEVDDAGDSASGVSAGAPKGGAGPADTTAAAAPALPRAAGDPPSAGVTEPSGALRLIASPAVRRMVAQHGISHGDLATVPRTGRGGRMLKADLLGWMEQPSQEPVLPSGPAPAPPASAVPASAPSLIATHPVPVRQDQDTTIPVRGMTRTMVKTINISLSVPHFGLNEEVCIDALQEARKGPLGTTAKSLGVPLSLTPFFIKATSLAMLSYPVINAAYVPQASGKDSAVVHRAHHNIALAIDGPTGLVVPTIKCVETLSLFQVARELARLVGLAQAGQLTVTDLSDPTVSISNVGMLGGTTVSPRIVPPQVAIGAFGRAQRLPRYLDDTSATLVPKTLLPMSWAADHRIVDGATLAKFASLLRGYLEDPGSMLLHMV